MCCPRRILFYWVYQVACFITETETVARVLQHLPCCSFQTLQWRHNERECVSNHWRLDCLLKRFFRRRIKETSKLCVTGLCEGNLTVTGEFPTQRGPVPRKMFPFDDVMMKAFIGDEAVALDFVDLFDSIFHEICAQFALPCVVLWFRVTPVHSYTVQYRYNAVNILPEFSQKTHHSSPVRARYGVSFVDSISYSYSTPVTAVMYAISCYIGLRYNGTHLYLGLLRR